MGSGFLFVMSLNMFLIIMMITLCLSQKCFPKNPFLPNNQCQKGEREFANNSKVFANSQDKATLLEEILVEIFEIIGN